MNANKIINWGFEDEEDGEEEESEKEKEVCSVWHKNDKI